VRIGPEFAAVWRQSDPARLVAFELEFLARHRRDLALQKTTLLRGERTLEAFGRKTIDLAPGDAVLARKILRGLPHVEIGRRIEQRLPEKILELHLPHPKTAATGLRVIDSLPTHSASSIWPSLMRSPACITSSMPVPHTRWVSVAGTSSGTPEYSPMWRGSM
jgi:hypothetical protein